MRRAQRGDRGRRGPDRTRTRTCTLRPAIYRRWTLSALVAAVNVVAGRCAAAGCHVRIWQHQHLGVSRLFRPRSRDAALDARVLRQRLRLVGRWPTDRVYDDAGIETAAWDGDTRRGRT